MRWTSRTTAIVERLLFEQGWRVMTRREAVGALRNAGLPVSYRASPDSGHLIAQDVADDIRWTTDCEYDTCAFVVRLAAVPLGGEAPPERTTAKRGKVRLEHRGGHDSELWWFSVGPHRYVAAWRTPEWSIWGGPPTPVSDPAPIVVARSIGLSRTQPVTELTVPAGVRWVEDVHNVLRAWVEPWAADQQDTSD
ncbi:hypothetical protein [Thermomonospora umbrina]|uniref:hypothetical protein n=1 Tax=Thermomonospora umbrina TaxID=111806 RepID=UPI000E22FA50|nr:hypothetical protein [Thermomonospora umbrina]